MYFGGDADHDAHGVRLDGTFWDFTSDLAKGDTAYTTLALGAHTDTTYFVGILTFFAWLRRLISESPDGPVRSPTIPSPGAYGRLWRCYTSGGWLLCRLNIEGAAPHGIRVARQRSRTIARRGRANCTIHANAPYRLSRFATSGWRTHPGTVEQRRSQRYEPSSSQCGRGMVSHLVPLVVVADLVVWGRYDAIRKWHKLLTSADSEYWIQLSPGTAVGK